MDTCIDLAEKFLLVTHTHIIKTLGKKASRKIRKVTTKKLKREEFIARENRKDNNLKTT